MKVLAAIVLMLGLSASAAAETIEGRWKLIAVEDVRADGSIAGYPWGRNPVGSIVVAGGWCYLQLLSSDIPTFAAGAGKPSIGEQMKGEILSMHTAYTGPCIINEIESSLTFKVEASNRPTMVGTEAKRFFRFEQGKLIFSPAPSATFRNSHGIPISAGEKLTRRLILERP